MTKIVNNNAQNYKIISEDLYKNGIFDKRLKEIDNKYLVSYVNTRKYPTILFVIAKIMEMNKTEQNQVAMYVVNTLEWLSKKVNSSSK